MSIVCLCVLSTYPFAIQADIQLTAIQRDYTVILDQVATGNSLTAPWSHTAPTQISQFSALKLELTQNLGTNLQYLSEKTEY